MKRLTKRNELGDAILIDKLQGIGIMLNEDVEKICSYEDAEEEGRLHIAPCANGTTIYYLPNQDMVDMGFFEEGEIPETTYIYGYTEHMLGKLDKDWFLTLEATLEGKQ